MNEPTPILRAISAELRALEQAAAERGSVDEAELAGLYPAISDARDALARLAEAVRLPRQRLDH